MTNRGKNEDVNEKIWENEFDLWILHIKIRLYGTFHKNLRKKVFFEIFTCEGHRGVERVAKTARTNLTCLHFQTFDSFLFPYFNSNIFYSDPIHLLCIRWSFVIDSNLCSKHSITFKNTYLFSCWFHCVDIFYIKFKFYETFTVINSVTKIIIDWNTINLELLSFDLPYTCTFMF